MNRLAYYIRRLSYSSWRELLLKRMLSIPQKIYDVYARCIDRYNPVWKPPSGKISLCLPTIPPTSLKTEDIRRETAEFLIDMYLSHRFDLLGSGWISVSYEAMAPGLEGYRYSMNVPFNLEQILLPAHVEASRRIWALIDEDYVPIDWQKDHKCGYRWSQKQWYKDNRKVIGKVKGVDIKVPWELARMQHLPRLAVLCLVVPERTAECIKEFRNQSLDFFATNPPRMGVNWACTMDVAIRAANLILALTLFKGADENNILDERYLTLFAEAIYQHGSFIVDNLEWSKELTSNHYLADICGLLFVASSLNSSPATDLWLAFAIQELISCAREQFYDDGGNFESSTSYHRLSSEMLAYGTAVILGLSPERVNRLATIDCNAWKGVPPLRPLDEQEFKLENGKILLPTWFQEKLYRTGCLCIDLAGPDGTIPQFGDNDSGRFFCLTPLGRLITTKEACQIYLNLCGYQESLVEASSVDQPYWDEDPLDHSSFLGALKGLFKDKRFSAGTNLEASLTSKLSRDRSFTTPPFTGDSYYFPAPEGKVKPYDYIRSFEWKYITTTKYQLSAEVTPRSIRTAFYPHSGFYVFSCHPAFHLVVCLAPLGQKGRGGHSHNDKLSYELWVNGKHIEADPGTYLYTPLPHRRNQFRSTRAHNVPLLDGKEQNDWMEGSQGLFSMTPSSQIEVLEVTSSSLCALLTMPRGKAFIRRFSIVDHMLIIEDRSTHPMERTSFPWYSRGYGRLSLRKDAII